MMKKILSVLLVVLMLVGMIPATVFGASAAETTTVEFAVYASEGTLCNADLTEETFPEEE